MPQTPGQRLDACLAQHLSEQQTLQAKLEAQQVQLLELTRAIDTTRHELENLEAQMGEAVRDAVSQDDSLKRILGLIQTSGEQLTTQTASASPTLGDTDIYEPSKPAKASRFVSFDKPADERISARITPPQAAELEDCDFDFDDAFDTPEDILGEFTQDDEESTTCEDPIEAETEEVETQEVSTQEAQAQITETETAESESDSETDIASDSSDTVSESTDAIKDITGSLEALSETSNEASEASNEADTEEDDATSTNDGEQGAVIEAEITVTTQADEPQPEQASDTDITEVETPSEAAATSELEQHNDTLVDETVPIEDVSCDPASAAEEIQSALEQVAETEQDQNQEQEQPTPPSESQAAGEIPPAEASEDSTAQDAMANALAKQTAEAIVKTQEATEPINSNADDSTKEQSPPESKQAA